MTNKMQSQGRMLIVELDKSTKLAALQGCNLHYLASKKDTIIMEHRRSIKLPIPTMTFHTVTELVDAEARRIDSIEAQMQAEETFAEDLGV